MKTKQLRQRIEQTCCGTVLDKSAALELINEVEALIAHREHLLLEVLNVLECSLDAMKGHRFQEDEIINHLSAMKAIRHHFESKSTDDSILAAHTHLLTSGDETTTEVESEQANHVGLIVCSDWFWPCT